MLFNLPMMYKESSFQMLFNLDTVYYNSISTHILCLST